jgi:hypothetical protein
MEEVIAGLLGLVLAGLVYTGWTVKKIFDYVPNKPHNHKKDVNTEIFQGVDDALG